MQSCFLFFRSLTAGTGSRFASRSVAAAIACRVFGPGSDASAEMGFVFFTARQSFAQILGAENKEIKNLTIIDADAFNCKFGKTQTLWCLNRKRRRQQRSKRLRDDESTFHYDREQ
jgi:hypothetical protein